MTPQTVEALGYAAIRGFGPTHPRWARKLRFQVSNGRGR